MADDSGRLNQVFAETSFLYGGNAVFIEQIQEKWAKDPNSVSPAWRAFFDQLMDQPSVVADNADAGSWARDIPAVRDELTSAMDGLWPAVEAKAAKMPEKAAATVTGTAAPSPEALRAASRDSVRALMLIRAYRIRGHLQSNLDPLGISPKGTNPELEPSHWGFTDAD
ncbi:MAG: hypothetical protein B7Z26_03970, partial [Asticcacaulis sp. 32-58-5]